MSRRSGAFLRSGTLGVVKRSQVDKGDPRKRTIFDMRSMALDHLSAFSEIHHMIMDNRIEAPSVAHNGLVNASGKAVHRTVV